MLKANGFHLKKDLSRKPLNRNLLSHKILRLILGAFSLCIFLLSVSRVGQYWDYQEILIDVEQQISQNITQEDLSQQIQQSINQSELEDARSYLQIAKEHNIAIDYGYFENEIKQKDEPLKRIIKNSSDFVEGFIEGKSSNLAGVVGSITADFTIIGDARDLRKEYIKYQEGKPVDELIVVLSGAGIGLTALTVGSLGAASPAKTGASTIKHAVKSQQLTKTFQNQILKLGRKVFDWSAFTRILKQNTSLSNIRRAVKIAYQPKAIKPLSVIASKVNNIRKLSSLSDSLFLLKYIDNASELNRLEKVVVRHGNKTKVLFKLLGKSVIKTTRVLKKTIELFLSIVSSIISGLFSLLLFIGRRLI